MIIRISRRGVIAALSGAVSRPLAAYAQPGDRMRRIGVLMNGNQSDPLYKAYLAAFLQTFQRLGWRDGQNIRIDLRWPGGDPERIGAYAAELAATAPDLILCASSANLAALLRTTNTLRIVFVFVSDPVGQGFVSNLAHPGGNITGFSAYETAIAGKWLDLLKQVAPDLKRVGVVFNPDTAPQPTLFAPALKAAATSLGVEVDVTPVHKVVDFEPAISRVSRQSNSGLIFPPDQMTSSHKDVIVELAARYRLPAVYGVETYARAGGLIYYGFAQEIQLRQAAVYVDRILKGVSPGDLPIQQPTKFSLIVNLSAARSLGIELPTGLLLSADEVIE